MAFRYSTLVTSPNERSSQSWKRRSQPELFSELGSGDVVEQVPLSDLVCSHLSSMPEHGKLHDFLHQMSSRRRRSQPVPLQVAKRGSSKTLTRTGSGDRDDVLRSSQRAQMTRSTFMDTVVLLVNAFEEEEEASRSAKYRHSGKKSKRRSRRLNLLSRKPVEPATLSEVCT